MPKRPDMEKLIKLLVDMDQQQRATEQSGDREIAWFYWVGDVEEALGYQPGELFPEQGLSD